jgi:hypothetical protein
MQLSRAKGDSTSSFGAPIGHAEDQPDSLRQSPPACAFSVEPHTSLAREAVKLRLAVSVCFPIGGEQPAIFQAARGGVERALRYPTSRETCRRRCAMA